MKEHSFQPIKQELERKYQRPKNKPKTREAFQDEKTPMHMKDYFASFRASIQEKIRPNFQIEEHAQIEAMGKLITPELMKSYQSLLKSWQKETVVSKDHPERVFINVEEEKNALEINAWIDRLIQEVRTNRKDQLPETEQEELRVQGWMLFESIANVLNTRSIEKEVRALGKLDSDQKQLLVKDLARRYPFEKTDVEILTDLVMAEQTSDREPYSAKLLLETIARIWREYEVGKRKKDVAKISFGYLLAKGIDSFSPSLFANLIVQDRLQVEVFLEYMGLNKISDLIEIQTNIRMETLMSEIQEVLNKRIVQSLFFQEFEFIHDRSLGEVYSSLERGKHATLGLLRTVISDFLPTLTGIGMSVAFLTKLHPVLGAISVSSLPVMYHLARKKGRESKQIYEAERGKEEKIMTRLQTVKQGFEEIKVRPDVPAVATSVTEQINELARLNLTFSIKQMKDRWKTRLPFELTTVISAIIGGVLQKVGEITGGAILSNIQYSERLVGSVQGLVWQYFDRFAREVEDIQHMEDIFGAYDTIDHPEGEKEKKRIAVSELKHHTIAFRNIRYKQILRGVNLDIPEGQFVTIAGASGAGKTTLLRSLVGLYRPEAGTITVGDVDIQKIKRYGNESLYSVMTYSNQSPQVFAGMTLRENIVLWSQNSVPDAKIQEVLRDVHMASWTNRLDEEVTNMSGGEKVRLGLARSLVKDARILLLDEPTASLDSQTATDVRKIIKELNEKHPDITIICVSHDEELIKLGQRVVQMEDLQPAANKIK